MMSENLLVPRHLRTPPIGRKQVRKDANLPPQHKLAISLIPGYYGEDVRPPHMYFGCRIDEDRILKIAEKLGYPPPPGASAGPSSNAVANIAAKLYRDLDEIEMTYELVFTGVPNAGHNEELGVIYSFCTNYTLKTFPSKENLPKLLDMLGLEESDLKWWVSLDDWRWRRVDLEQERLANLVHDYLLAQEWAGVLERADERKRLRGKQEKAERLRRLAENGAQESEA